MDTIIQMIENAPKKKITLADKQALIDSRRKFNALPKTAVEDLFYMAAIRALENRENVGVVTLVDFFIQDETGIFNNPVVARFTPSRPILRHENVNLLASDFTMGVQLGFSITGDVDEGFVGSPLPMFYTSHIILFEDGKTEEGTGLEALDYENWGLE